MTTAAGWHGQGAGPDGKARSHPSLMQLQLQSMLPNHVTCRKDISNAAISFPQELHIRTASYMPASEAVVSIELTLQGHGP